ncbi:MULTISPECIES: RDD family protein [unclassified Streptomyces]|uniref:RDD family protein n=1 Tax=unclassified Streptomyces TaxID=2593676 RepID=UPI0020337987|nr:MULTISPECIES: RDD family protein [unclassified Streptomyces]MCM2421159.1 RDD family protein [Streptomyces sp. RKAG293]MCM2426640.1 RDD family protein [Streptomyces sp. RKAG337]
MSYPPGPNNPYGQPQQPPQSPQGYGYPQQPPQFPQQNQGQYGYPQGGLPPGMPPLASWGARAGATLLDFLIVGLVPTVLLAVGYIKFLKVFVDAVDKCDAANTDTCPVPPMPGSSLAMIAIGGMLSLAGTLWLCYREGSTGQTPGKKIAGIHLLREADGQVLGFGMAFVRRLCHALDGMACYIGYLWPLWDEKNQTFADKIMHTVVVKRP